MNTKPFSIETKRPTYSAKDRVDWTPQPKETKEEKCRKHLQYAEEWLNTLKNGESQGSLRVPGGSSEADMDDREVGLRRGGEENQASLCRGLQVHPG